MNKEELVAKLIRGKLPPNPTDLDILKVSWLRNKKTWKHNRRLWKKFIKSPRTYVSESIGNEIKFRNLGKVMSEQLKETLSRGSITDRIFKGV